MNNRSIYLDYNATTPCAKEVVEAMLPFFSDSFGNAASPHEFGTDASAAVEKARDQVASAIGADASEIIFTSGATEANNLALLGLTRGNSKRKGIVSTSIEHKSVLEPLARLLDLGIEVYYLPVNRHGVVNPTDAEKIINEDTAVVTVQGANNEIGTLQPVTEIARIAHKKGALVHCDAVQLLGKVPVSVGDLHADLASFSAHKAYGPKGIGCLFLNRHARRTISPLIHGGSQESGLRPGTVNVPAIVGFGVACDLVKQKVGSDAKRLAEMRDLLESILTEKLSGVSLNGKEVSRLPGTTNISVPGVSAGVLISQVRGVCFSDGSACTSGAVSPSHVLLALELSREMARNTVRLSLGRYNTIDEVEIAAEKLVETIQKLTKKLSIT